MKALILAIVVAISIQPAIAGSVFIPKNIQQQLKHAANINWPGDFEVQKYRIANPTEAD